MKNKVPLISLGVIMLAAVLMGVHQRSELEQQKIQRNASSNEPNQTARIYGFICEKKEGKLWLQTRQSIDVIEVVQFKEGVVKCSPEAGDLDIGHERFLMSNAGTYSVGGKVYPRTFITNSYQLHPGSLISIDDNKSFQERFGKAMKDSICNDLKNASEEDKNKRSYSDFAKLLNYNGIQCGKVNSINFNYEMTSSPETKAIQPIFVGDNGISTFFQFPINVKPMVFYIDSAGKEKVAEHSYIFEAQNLMVISLVAKEWRIRLSEKVIGIRNGEAHD